jgi:hypothetical protein
VGGLRGGGRKGEQNCVLCVCVCVGRRGILWETLQRNIKAAPTMLAADSIVAQCLLGGAA